MISGSTDKEVGESEPKETKGHKLFINVHHCGDWNSVFLGPSETPWGPSLRNLFPKDRRAGASFHPLGVTGGRVAAKRVFYHPLPQHTFGRLLLVAEQVL